MRVALFLESYETRKSVVKQRLRRQLQCTVTHVLSNHRKLCIKVYQC